MYIYIPIGGARTLADTTTPPQIGQWGVFGEISPPGTGGTSSTNHNIYREEVFEAIWVILVLEAQKWMRFFEVGQLLTINVSMQ